MLYVVTDMNQVYLEGDALNRRIDEVIRVLLIISRYQCVYFSYLLEF
jgi:hypothetical protein